MFGFGKGKVGIKLESYQFNQGDEIRGTVTVKMKKPVDANELVITLNGKETATSRNFKGEQSSRTYTICDQPITLEGQKHFDASSAAATYPFNIKIPIVQSQQQAPENKVLGAAIKMAQVAMRSRTRQKWWLRARLDVPGLDVRSKRAKIQVNPAAPTGQPQPQNI